VECVAKTIYRVEGTSPGGESPDPGFPSPDLLELQAGSGIHGASRPGGAARLGKQKLFWVLVGIALLTIIMIVVIAALGATESPAVGTVPGPEPVSSTAPVTTQPVGTSTTEAQSTTTSAAVTTSSSGSTTTTLLTHKIADPVRIVIPALDVDAKMVAVGLVNGTDMEVPKVGIVGWCDLGPAPGESGPSVLVSHVSWNGTKGVFYKLKELEPGDQVLVYDASGDHAIFEVDSTETILKSDLPTDRIWNETDQAVIRLVTCGGKYDSKTGHYLSNVIVYGHLVR
jgi:LPXTG-site transpeptidase (sortase) family protein